MFSSSQANGLRQSESLCSWLFSELPKMAGEINRVGSHESIHIMLLRSLQKRIWLRKMQACATVNWSPRPFAHWSRNPLHIIFVCTGQGRGRAGTAKNERGSFYFSFSEQSVKLSSGPRRNALAFYANVFSATVWWKERVQIEPVSFPSK